MKRGSTTEQLELLKNEGESLLEEELEMGTKILNWNKSVHSGIIRDALKTTARALGRWQCTTLEKINRTGTSYTCLRVNSGDITLILEELFANQITNVEAFGVSLAFMSIFIPVQIVRWYWTFSKEDIFVVRLG